MGVTPALVSAGYPLKLGIVSGYSLDCEPEVVRDIIVGDRANGDRPQEYWNLAFHLRQLLFTYDQIFKLDPRIREDLGY